MYNSMKRFIQANAIGVERPSSTFAKAIQSRLNDGEGFYTDGDKAVWLNNSMIDGSYVDIWCELTLLESMEYDPSLNYGAIPTPPLTLSAAAAIANKDTSSLRRAIARKHLPAAKIGRDWFVTREDLQAWMDNAAMHVRGVKAK